jgi:hypothetical protein
MPERPRPATTIWSEARMPSTKASCVPSGTPASADATAET